MLFKIKKMVDIKFSFFVYDNYNGRKKMSNNEKKDFENLKKDDNKKFNPKIFIILLVWGLLSITSAYTAWLLVKEDDTIVSFLFNEEEKKDVKKDVKKEAESIKENTSNKVSNKKESIKKETLSKNQVVEKKEDVKLSLKKEEKKEKKSVFSSLPNEQTDGMKPETLAKINQKYANSTLQSSTWFSDYKVMKANVQYYNEIHPFIYGIEGDAKNTGRLTSMWSHQAKLKRVAELRSLNPNVKIIPTIFRWENDQKKISEVIGYKDAENIRDKHISIIMKEIKTYNYDGIDIDYEGMECHKKQYFEKFLMLLSKKMKEENKILSVAVHPKTFAKKNKKIYCKANKKTSTVAYRESWRGPTAHDYSFLAKYTDKVKIMAYEFHPRKYKDPGPGPQAPNVWLKEVIKYAKSKIPTHKLYMAIPTYGYDWGLNCKPRVRPVFYGSIQDRMKIGKHYQPTDVNKIIAKYGKKKEWINLSKFSKIHSGKVYEDPSIWYTKNGCDRVAFYMNKEAFVKKMELLMSYKLGGFSFWQLRGDNDPGINIYLSKLLKEQNNASTQENLTQKTLENKATNINSEKEQMPKNESENDVVFQEKTKSS